MVEMSSDKFVCIVDDSKLVDALGGSKGNLSSIKCEYYRGTYDQKRYVSFLCSFFSK